MGLAFGVIWFPTIIRAPGQVTATVETVPVTHPPDAADDMAIWIHPTDPSLSTIIGTDKQGAFEVYDLSGARLQSIPIRTNNVDLRYNFPLAGQLVALVVTYDKTNLRFAAFKVDPVTRQLVDVTDPTNESIMAFGSAMYHSPITGKYYYLSSKHGVLRQFELSDNGSGNVSIQLVRSVTFNSSLKESEGVVADDVLARIYVSDEGDTIYRIGAEPDSELALTTVDVPLSQGGHFKPDVEGLTIYYKSNGTGYLFASSQGNDTYTVYTREGDNTYLGTFRVGEGIYDEVSNTDGIDVTNFPLGSAFPMGMLVVHDGKNYDGTSLEYQNFKYIPFESIAASLSLTMDPSWDPRRIGAP